MVAGTCPRMLCAGETALGGQVQLTGGSSAFLCSDTARPQPAEAPPPTSSLPIDLQSQGKKLGFISILRWHQSFDAFARESKSLLNNSDVLHRILAAP